MTYESAEPVVRHPRLMVVAACGSVATVIGLALGTTAMLPAIGHDLQADQTELQWIADVFPLVVAALLLPAGALLDRLGRRFGMLVGLVILVAALVWAALASSGAELVIARAVSGVGGALVFPGTLVTVSEAIRGNRRTFAVAIWGVSAVVGGVGAINLCALLVEIDSWRAAFWVLAAVCALLVALTAYAVPETHQPGDARFDTVGAILSILGTGALVFGITEAPVHGWQGPMTVTGIAGGLLALAAFVVWELRHPHPMLDVRLFADGRFGGASLALFAMFVADFAMLFLVFQYEVYVLGYGTLKAALGTLPPGIIMLVTVPLSFVSGRRLGERATVVLALVTIAVGTAFSAVVAGHEGSYVYMVIGNTLIWAGIALGALAPTTAILEGLPREQHGVASAVNDITREFGAALGIAIAGSAFNAAYRGTVGDRVANMDPDLVRTITDSPAAGLALAERGGVPDGFGTIVRDGVLDGWQAAFLAVTLVMVVSAALVAARYPRHNASPEQGRDLAKDSEPRRDAERLSPKPS